MSQEIFTNEFIFKDGIGSHVYIPSPVKVMKEPSVFDNIIIDAPPVSGEIIQNNQLSERVKEYYFYCASLVDGVSFVRMDTQVIEGYKDGVKGANILVEFQNKKNQENVFITRSSVDKHLKLNSIQI